MFRLGLGGHADQIVEVGVGIPSHDSDTAQRSHERADRGPGAEFSPCPSGGIQVRSNGGRLDRDEKRTHAACGLVVEDRAVPQVALEVPEDALHPGQRGVEGPDVGSGHVAVAGFD